MSALTNRLRAATVGLGITVAPLVIIATVQFILMPHTLPTLEGLSSNQRDLAVAYQRMQWSFLYIVAATLFFIYWLLAAMLGTGQLLRLRAANVTLALCLFALMVLALYGSFVQWPDNIKDICRLLNISDVDAPLYACDAQSSCDHFVFTTHMSIIFWLVGLSIILLATSLIVRIVSSRHASSPDG